MPTDVVMPQLGESIAEGTIVRWLKKVGDKVQRDEPLLEVSTDKVDTEIPAAAGGTLLAILAQEGDTVGVNTVIAQLGEEGEKPELAEASPAISAPPPGESAVAPPPVPVAPPPAPSAPAAAPAAGGAATSVVMPQLGESIAEGTVVRWLKKIGDTVQRDEPLLEVSTDKVDTEIPSPVAGTLLSILAQEGETVGVNTAIATIGEAGAAAPAPPPAAPVTPAAPAAAPPPVAPPAPPVVAAAAVGGSIEDLRRVKSSPVVRKIAAENGVNIAHIAGSGILGRVTKKIF
ncbi:MAG: biotin/lipoyl-containing protein [Blastocatellia bacterium]